LIKPYTPFFYCEARLSSAAAAYRQQSVNALNRIFNVLQNLPKVPGIETKNVIHQSTLKSIAAAKLQERKSVRMTQAFLSFKQSKHQQAK